MKKMMISLLLVLLGALCIGGAGCAEGTLTVALNDGAPIPYLDGTDSLMITDPEGLRGVTGAANATLEDITPGCTLTLQNISLTDDVLAVFFRVQSEAPLNLWAGLTPDALSYAIPRLNCFMERSVPCQGRPEPGGLSPGRREYPVLPGGLLAP